MPIVTQSRETGKKVYTSYFRSYNGTHKSYPPVTVTVSDGLQKTTSYRSKGPSPDMDDEEALLSGIRNRQEFAKRMKDNYRTKYDNGHEFSTEKEVLGQRQNISQEMACHDGGTTWNYYKGYIYPSQGVGVNIYPPINDFHPSVSLQDVDGRALMASSLPTRPEAALSQLLFELKEKLPQLVGMQTFLRGPNAKSLGGEHLNVEFGIKPVISDIQKLADSILQFSKLVEQYCKDSGSQIRRKRVLSRDAKTVERANYPGNVLLGTRSDGALGSSLFYSGGGGCSIRCYDTYQIEVKFAGAFSYHLSEGNSFLGKVQMYEQLAAKLLGTRFTTETLYELTPWSWLFDWIGDAGTFMTNVNALSSDSLVMRYGYVMHHTVANRFRHIAVMPAPRTTRYGGYPTSVSLISSVEKKTRRRASPYGFGITEESFSGKQWAILAALGMSKSPTSLH